MAISLQYFTNPLEKSQKGQKDDDLSATGQVNARSRAQPFITHRSFTDQIIRFIMSEYATSEENWSSATSEDQWSSTNSEENWSYTNFYYEDFQSLENLPAMEGKKKGETSTKWQRKRAYELTLPLHVRQKRRLAANARERKRMTSLNQVKIESSNNQISFYLSFALVD